MLNTRYGGCFAISALGGIITLKFKSTPDAHPLIADGIMALTPAAHEGSISWACSNNDNATASPDITKFLPSSCQE